MTNFPSSLEATVTRVERENMKTVMTLDVDKSTLKGVRVEIPLGLDVRRGYHVEFAFAKVVGGEIVDFNAMAIYSGHMGERGPLFSASASILRPQYER